MHVVVSDDSLLPIFWGKQRFSVWFCVCKCSGACVTVQFHFFSRRPGYISYHCVLWLPKKKETCYRRRRLHRLPCLHRKSWWLPRASHSSIDADSRGRWWVDCGFWSRTLSTKTDQERGEANGSPHPIEDEEAPERHIGVNLVDSRGLSTSFESLFCR